MKHMDSFNGAITSALHRLGLDSKMVLDAVNAFIGNVEADAAKTKTTGKASLTGKLTEKSDTRKVTIRESEKRQAEVRVCAQSRLYALSCDLDKLTDRHEMSVGEITLPTEVEAWCNRDSWKLPELKAKQDEKREAEKAARAAMEYGA